MTSEAGNDLEKIFRSLQRLDQQKAEELRAIIYKGNLIAGLNEIQERYEDTLCYLANFDSAISQNGKVIPIQDVWTRLQCEMRKVFKKISGEEYISPIVKRNLKR